MDGSEGQQLLISSMSRIHLTAFAGRQYNIARVAEKPQGAIDERRDSPT
jgi:hypothetical protein